MIRLCVSDPCICTYGLRGSSDALEEGGREECDIEGARAFKEPLIEGGENSRPSASKAGVAIITPSLKQNERLADSHQPVIPRARDPSDRTVWEEIVRELSSGACI
jgi:hypothetical protein